MGCYLWARIFLKCLGVTEYYTILHCNTHYTGHICVLFLLCIYIANNVPGLSDIISLFYANNKYYSVLITKCFNFSESGLGNWIVNPSVIILPCLAFWCSGKCEISSNTLLKMILVHFGQSLESFTLSYTCVLLHQVMYGFDVPTLKTLFRLT